MIGLPLHKRNQKRCGCCRFYQVQSALHVVGQCQADPSRHMVFRTDACPTFCFSERAMARDRLAQHPATLKHSFTPPAPATQPTSHEERQGSPQQ